MLIASAKGNKNTLKGEIYILFLQQPSRLFTLVQMTFDFRPNLILVIHCPDKDDKINER